MATQAKEVFLTPPLSIAGCGLWLDAADSSTITGTSSVTAWRDKTSSLTLTGSGSTYTTVSGYPAITFNGNQLVSSTNIPYERVCTSNANFTTFIVQLTTSSSGINGLLFTIILPDNSRRLAVFSNGGGSGGIFFDGGSQASPRLGGITQTLNTPQLLSITRKNITTMTARLNGSQVSSSDFPGTTDFISSNSYFVYITDSWRGNMYEIVHYNRDLSDLEIQQMEGYLAWKWGLQALLPRSHPFFSASPYQTLSVPISRSIALKISSFTSFIPTSVSGCQLWLDAADSSRFTYSSGSNISIWADKSPGGNNLTTQSGTPTYTRDGSLNVVNFPSGAILQTSFTFTIKTSSAFFVIAKLTSTSTGYPMILTLIDNNSGDYSIRYSGSVVNYGNSDDIGNGNYYTNGSPNTNASFLNQYVIIDTTTATRAASSRISLSGTFGGRYFIGNIAEVIVYPDGVNSTQRQQLQGYLAWKWGLQQSLPTTHPYYSNPYVPYSLPRVVTKASIQVWSPLRVSGCSMWLDGNDPAGTGAQPSSGATVSTWNDKSGTSNNATSGSATFLKDSLGGYLNFTGSQTYTITNPNVVVNQYFTVFIVEQIQNYNPPNTLGILAAPNEGPTNTNLVIYYNNSTDASFAFYGNDIYAAVSPAFTTNQAQPTRIWSASFIPNSRNLYINGVSIGADTNNTFLTAWVGARVGYWRYGNYTGKLREIMIYSGIVNTPQRQQVEGYLAWKWGLRSNLPGGHPYINFPPSP